MELKISVHKVKDGKSEPISYEYMTGKQIEKIIARAVKKRLKGYIPEDVKIMARIEEIEIN